jgi:hypothetical protein
VECRLTSVIRWNLVMQKYNILKISVFVLGLVASSPVLAFDDEVKTMAQRPELQRIASNFANIIDLADYGACVAGWTSASVLWVRNPNLEQDVQLVWQLIGDGLALYRQNFIASYRTEEPLSNVVRQMGGAYYQANQASILSNCNNLLSQAMQ